MRVAAKLCTFNQDGVNVLACHVSVLQLLDYGLSRLQITEVVQRTENKALRRVEHCLAGYLYPDSRNINDPEKKTQRARQT